MRPVINYTKGQDNRNIKGQIPNHHIYLDKK